MLLAREEEEVEAVAGGGQEEDIDPPLLPSHQATNASSGQNPEAAEGRGNLPPLHRKGWGDAGLHAYRYLQL